MTCIVGAWNLLCIGFCMRYREEKCLYRSRPIVGGICRPRSVIDVVWALCDTFGPLHMFARNCMEERYAPCNNEVMLMMRPMFWFRFLLGETMFPSACSPGAGSCPSICASSEDDLRVPYSHDKKRN